MCCVWRWIYDATCSCERFEVISHIFEVIGYHQLNCWYPITSNLSYDNCHVYTSVEFVSDDNNTNDGGLKNVGEVITRTELYLLLHIPM